MLRCFRGYMVHITPCREDNLCACGGDITEVTVTLPVLAKTNLDFSEDPPSKWYDHLTEVTLVDKIMHEAAARRARDLHRIDKQKKREIPPLSLGVYWNATG